VIAADSSLLVKFFSKEEGWGEAKKVIEQGVVSLDLAVKEVANALWKKVLRKELAESDAVSLILDLASGEVVKLYDQDRYLKEAFQMAVRHRITVYDALFISLAKMENLELATCDRKQALSAEKEGVNVKLIE